MSHPRTQRYARALSAPGGRVQFLMAPRAMKTMLYAGVTGFQDLASDENQILALRDISVGKDSLGQISIVQVRASLVQTGTARNREFQHG